MREKIMDITQTTHAVGETPVYTAAAGWQIRDTNGGLIQAIIRRHDIRDGQCNVSISAWKLSCPATLKARDGTHVFSVAGLESFHAETETLQLRRVVETSFVSDSSTRRHSRQKQIQWQTRLSSGYHYRWRYDNLVFAVFYVRCHCHRYKCA